MASLPLESAIPSHLQQERTCPSKLQPNFTPPFPAWTSRFAISTQNIVMAVIGAQHSSPPSSSQTSSPSPTEAGIPKIKSFIASTSASEECRPSHYDTASYTDEQGYYNIAIFAYWPSTDSYDSWFTSSGFKEWWEGLDPASSTYPPCGYFLEVFTPSMDRWENVISLEDVKEGAGCMREGISHCPIKEHGYWGSTRDRIPLSQTDGLAGEGEKGEEEGMGDNLKRMDSGNENQGENAGIGTNVSTQRIKVSGRKNLCVIRSGQDWSSTRPEERKLYLERMHPVLQKGMAFLASPAGREEVGCYDCRFMTILDPSLQSSTTDRTFGLAYFDELASLEKWAAKHKTHLDIFGRFLKYTKDLDHDISLKLWHDVMVLESGQQRLEYVGCHTSTGMLRSLS